MTLYPNGIDDNTTLPPVTPGSGIATPIGPAGGDLSGTYPDPTVTGGGGGFTAGGDLSGTSTNQQVIGIRTHSVPTPTGTGTVLTWSGSSLSWAMGGGGSGGGNIFVYQQGATPAGNLYATFDTAYTAARASADTGIPSVLAIDDRNGTCTTGTSFYNFDNITLIGVLHGVGNNCERISTLVVANGMTYENLVYVQDIQINCIGVVTQMLTTGCCGEVFMYWNNVHIEPPTGSASFIQLEGTLLLAHLVGCTIDAGNFINGDFPSVNFFAYQSTTIASCVIGTSGFLAANIDDTSSIATQSSFSGSVAPTNLLSISSSIFYSATTPGNWSPAPVQVAAALDQLAARGGGTSFDTVDVENDTDGSALGNTANYLVLLLGFTINHAKFLPASPAIGQRVTFKDYDGSFANFQFTIHRNGNLINGVAADYVINNSPYLAITIQFASVAQGWVIVTPNTVPSGTTGQRPTLTSTNTGVIFFDTTLHYLVTWDGTNWRNGAGGIV